MRLLLGLLLTMSACLSEVDVSDLPSKDGYQDWPSLETAGDVPPHSDARRVIYLNEVALTYSGSGEYPLGSVLVKDILTDDGTDISYIAVMRRIDFEPDGGRLEGEYEGRAGGWLFTRADDGDSEEVQGITCWDTCHVQAPFAGAWLDYRSLLQP